MISWKTVAKNVLSGCVGGMVVMCAAQAQKSTPARSTAPVQNEIRTHRLVVVDENNKQVGLFEGDAGNASFELRSGRSGVYLSASDKTGATMSANGQGQGIVTIDASDVNATVVLGCKAYCASLKAAENEAGLGLFKSPPKNAKQTITGRGTNGTKEGTNGTKQIIAAVDDESTDITAYGAKSSMSVGDEKTRTRGALNWNSYPGSASLDLRDNAGHTFWSQPK